MMKNKNKKNNNNNNDNDNKNNTNKTLNKRRSSIDKSMILLRMEDIQREKRNSISINNIKLLKAKRNSIKSLLSENIITDSGIDKLKNEINQLKNCLKEYEEEGDRYKKI
jgi:mevalonate kinase